MDLSLGGVLDFPVSVKGFVMNLSQTEAYRSAAAHERSEAERSVLPLVRERHLRSAEAWDAMATQGEMTERLAQANAENRIKQPYQRRSSTEGT